MTSGDQAVVGRELRPRPGIVGWLLAAASILVVVLAVAVGVRYALLTGQTRSLLSHQSLTPFITIGFALLGALVASRRPRNPVGWLLLATAVFYALNVLAVVIGLAGPSPSPAADLATWLNIWLWIPGVFLPTLFLFLLFPNGRLPSRRWRPVAWASGLGLLAVVLALALHPGPLDSWGTDPNPYGIQSLAPILELLIDLATPLLLLGVVGSVAALIVRFRRSRGVERSQMKWLVYAAGLMLVGFVASGIIWYLWPDSLLAGELSIALTNLSILGIGAAAAVAVLRYHLYDIDLIVNRTLVYGGLTSIVVAVYALSVGATSLALQQDNRLAGLVLTMALALAFYRPLRSAMERGANRIASAPGNVGPGMAAAAPASGELVVELEADGAAAPDRWLRIARFGWYGAAAVALAILILGIPGYLLRRPLGNLGDHLLYQPAPLMALLNLLNLALLFASSLLSLGLATLLFRKRPYDGMALFLSYYLLVHGTLMASSIESLEYLRPGMAALNSYVLLPVIYVPLTLALLAMFPDGRFVPRWSRWLVALAVLLAPMAYSLAGPFRPMPVDPLVNRLIPVTQVAYLGLFTGIVLAQIYRYRRVSNLQQRQQTKWVLYGFGIMFTLMALGSVPWSIAISLPAGTPMPWWVPLAEMVWALSAMLLPISLSVAVLRYRLYDIDLIINRTLVYGGLTAAVVGLYALVVGALGTVFQTQGNLLIALLATGLVAVLFQPLRERLQRGVNRLVYGERDDPVKVLSRLGRQLEVAMAPDVILPTLVETVAQTLKLPYVAISLRRNGDFELAAEYGKPVSETLLLPLIYQSEPVGQLIVAPRSPDESFSPADQALLGNIAHQAGPAVHAVRLTADLQRSRQRLVTAREEERRRLRRDLHDGLGPALAALHLQAAVLRHLVYRDQEAAEAMIGEFRQDIRAAIDDIRRVVYELRPPALDQLGLVAALQAQASRYSLEAEAVPGKGGPSNGGPSLSRDGLRVTVEAPQTLPSLPAAVEVAAYRIVQEALANVVHHAQAHCCAIRLELNGALEIQVVDDGAGLPPDYRPGVGLVSMKERAEELGGEFAIQKLGQRGTRVSARLPLGEA